MNEKEAKTNDAGKETSDNDLDEANLHGFTREVEWDLACVQEDLRTLWKNLGRVTAWSRNCLKPETMDSLHAIQRIWTEAENLYAKREMNDQAILTLLAQVRYKGEPLVPFLYSRAIILRETNDLMLQRGMSLQKTFHEEFEKMKERRQIR